jgi:hypothetical protein
MGEEETLHDGRYGEEEGILYCEADLLKPSENILF